MDCQELIDKTINEMGKIDILICNAGVCRLTYKPGVTEFILENISEEDWDATIDINLKGVFLCNQAIAPYFRKQKQGKTVNISPIAGRKGQDMVPHYSASKAGVIAFTQGLLCNLPLLI